MKGAILEEGLEFYTFLDEILPAFENEQLEYNWLITALEYVNDGDDLPYQENHAWLSGKELTDFVYSQKTQFIWGVLSAFKPSITLEQVLEYELPWADGYGGFWENPVSIQHPLAEIEIVPWDSSLVLVIAKNDALIDRFLRYFPLAEDLASYNSK